MSKISAIDFANNVDSNRKRLIKHCRDNGLTVNENETLENVVTINDDINIKQSEETFVVEFKDLDGNNFVPPQYVKKGESAIIPEGYPELDSEYLEFVEWAFPVDDDLTNVQRDILCLPQYQTKYDETTGQRPTYLFCYFEESYLSPLFAIPTRTNTFIDWGDGSEPQQVTTNTINHTYANKGLYVIKIYGDNYEIGGNSNAGLFTTSYYTTCLLKAYMGENGKVSNFQKCYSLKKAVLSLKQTTLNYTFSECSSLERVVIPNSVISTIYNVFYNCTSLTNVIMTGSFGDSLSLYILEAKFVSGCSSLKSFRIPNKCKSIGSSAFNGCASLVDLNLPNSIESIKDSAFSGMYNLKNINIPENITFISNSTLQYCHGLRKIVLSSNISTIGAAAFSSCSNLLEIVIQNPLIKLENPNIFNGCTSVSNLVLPQDFDGLGTINFSYFALSNDCLIDITKKLKDNSSTSAKTITFSENKHKTRMETIYLNEFDEEVPYKTNGAISLLEKIQNKNWTVSFSN